MNWSLFFEADYSNRILSAGTIQIVPTNWNWNDFSYNFNALITITPPDNRKQLSLPAYVVPLIGSHPGRLRQWIVNNQNFSQHTAYPNSTTSVNGNMVFATLLGNEQGYADLAQWVYSKEELNLILSALNDVVWLKQSSYSMEVERLTTQTPFVLGVLRSPSAYRAMRRGIRALIGGTIPQLAETRSNFSIRSQLHGFENGTHDLTIQFQDLELLEDRIHCLIGINGSGKTRLLRELVLTLGRLPANEDFSGEAFVERSEAVTSTEYSGATYNRLLVLSTAGEDRFPSRSQNEGNLEYQYFNLKDVGKVGSVRGEANPLTTLMVDLIRDGSKFSESPSGDSLTRYALLKRTLKDHIDLELLYLPVSSSVSQDSYVYQDETGEYYVRALDIVQMNEQRHLLFTSSVQTTRRIGFFAKTEQGNVIRVLHLSSGQNVFFQFALRLISSIDNGTLVIIDEPETHLHPNLICEFTTLLYIVLAATKSIALVATHSAYVVREVPTHCVHVFSFIENSRQVDIGRVRMKTLGASIDSISQAVFGDATARKFHEKFAREIASSGVSQEELLIKYGSVLSPELLIEIRALMQPRSWN